jgi:hypothetical protein
VKGFALLALAASAALVSNYLIAVNRHHLFNPAAFGAAEHQDRGKGTVHRHPPKTIE